jgi:hypothetical protein
MWCPRPLAIRDWRPSFRGVASSHHPSHLPAANDWPGWAMAISCLRRAVPQRRPKSRAGHE